MARRAFGLAGPLGVVFCPRGLPVLPIVLFTLYAPPLCHVRHGLGCAATRNSVMALANPILEGLLSLGPWPFTAFFFFSLRFCFS